MITPTEPSSLLDAKIQAVPAPELPPAPSSEVGKPQRFLRFLVSLILLGIAAFAFYYFIILPGHHEHFFSSKQVAPEAKKKPLDVELVEGTSDTLAVPKQVRASLGIKGVAVATVPKHGRPLVMPGSTALDPTRLMRVRTRFNAEPMSRTPSVHRPGRSRAAPSRSRPGSPLRRPAPAGRPW